MAHRLNAQTPKRPSSIAHRRSPIVR